MTWAMANDGMTDPAGTLTRAGWHPGRDAGDEAMHAITRTAGLGPWILFPAAERAVREFYGLRLEPAAHGGSEVAATGCVVDPQEARYSGPALHRLADTLDTRLFPLGRTDADAPMAVDERGRLFSVGTGGAWLLGDTVSDGLTALTEGRRPLHVRARKWHWPLTATPADLAAAVRAALVAIYVLHTSGLFDARTLHVRATSLGGAGVRVLDETLPLRPGPLEDSATPLIEAMEKELSAVSQTPHSCELTLTVPAPPDTPAPLSELTCQLTVGGAEGFTLSLSTPPAASLGHPATLVDACVKAFDTWSTPQSTSS
ncbi:SUKH-3 domain-containing protein [Streptomyces sp. NBC_01353]|uniref:SUKH-3 domain-containing protein n=1 Tax=Streptomyces sp. NBC_01353 TaxID=2903835 RepID=UPI002E3146BA|nr:SUKH-3 domain-containing protein [Streptomyces sp. NBC_01353]